MADAGTLVGIGTALVLSGILIVILAFFFVYFRKGEEGKIRGGGAVIIGPIPIVFGTDKKAVKTVLYLSIVLTLLLLTAMIVGYLLG